MDQARKLGFWETGQALLHDDAHGAGTIFVATYLRGKVDHVLLRESLHLMFQKHPLLRSTIHRTHKGYFFNLGADFHNIPIHFIHRDGEHHWLDIGERELSVQFPTHEYLWRAALIYSKGEQNELILSFHHSIIDGLSCVNFVDELLRFYADLELQTFKNLKPLLLMPAVEHLLAYHPTKESIEQEIRDLDKPEVVKLNYQTIVPLEKRVTKNRVEVILKERLRKIKESCRANCVNVNSLLNAALLLAQEQVLGKPLQTLITTPINLRSFCEPKIDDRPMGVFISYVTDFSGEINDNSSLWQLAQNYQERISALIPRVAFLPEEFEMEDLGKLVPVFDIKGLKERKAFPSSTCVTNKGIFDFPEIYGTLKLEAFFVTSSPQLAHIQVHLSVASILERMFLCFSYCYPLVHSEYIEEVADRFLKILP